MSEPKYIDLKHELVEKFTEIVAVRLDVLEQRLLGTWPPNTDIGRGVRRYAGTPLDRLPPYTVEINHFKNEVDQFVAMLMRAVDDAAPSPKDPRDEALRVAREALGFYADRDSYYEGSPGNEVPEEGFAWQCDMGDKAAEALRQIKELMGEK